MLVLLGKKQVLDQGLMNGVRNEDITKKFVDSLKESHQNWDVVLMFYFILLNRHLYNTIDQELFKAIYKHKLS